MALPPSSKVRWGNWHYCPDNLTLELRRENGNVRYSVDLEKCGTATQILDGVLQIGSKEWGPEVVGDLVEALIDLSDFNLQGAVCPGGRKGPGFDWKRHLTEVHPRTVPE